MGWTLPDLSDDHGQDLQVLDMDFRDFGGRDKFCGEIVTIKCFEDNSRAKEQVYEPGHGRVLVVDGGGSMRCALLGDMLGAAAAENGWAGLLIYGCVRDVEILATIDLGVRALRAHPVRSFKRGEGLLNEPLHFAGVTVQPGGWLYADQNGTAVAPGRLHSA